MASFFCGDIVGHRLRFLVDRPGRDIWPPRADACTAVGKVNGLVALLVLATSVGSRGVNYHVSAWSERVRCFWFVYASEVAVRWRRDGDGRWSLVDASERHAFQLSSRALSHSKSLPAFARLSVQATSLSAGLGPPSFC